MKSDAFRSVYTSAGDRHFSGEEAGKIHAASCEVHFQSTNHLKHLAYKKGRHNTHSRRREVKFGEDSSVS